MEVKIPTKGSTRYKVLAAIYKHGPIKIADLANRTPTIRRESIADAISACMTLGLLERNVYTYSLRDAVRKYFDGCEEETVFVGQIVPPRKYSVYDSPGLSAKYQISANGQRAGANDYKDWPSHYGRAA